MKLWHILVVLCVCGLSACGDDGRISATTTRELSPINLTEIAPFHELYEFPGSISGFVSNFTLFTLNSLEVCFNIDLGRINDESGEFPLVVSIANIDYVPEMFRVSQTETADRYCFNPLVQEGVYNINVELLLDSGLELYSWNFQSTLPQPFELSSFTGELSGLEWITGDMLAALDVEIERTVRHLIHAGVPICVEVADAEIIGGTVREQVQIALDNRLLSVSSGELTVGRTSDGERFCMTSVPQSGVHELYILMTTSPTFPPSQLAFVGEFLVVEAE